GRRAARPRIFQYYLRQERGLKTPRGPRAPARTAEAHRLLPERPPRRAQPRRRPRSSPQPRPRGRRRVRRARPGARRSEFFAEVYSCPFPLHVDVGIRGEIDLSEVQVPGRWPEIPTGGPKRGFAAVGRDIQLRIHGDVGREEVVDDVVIHGLFADLLSLVPRFLEKVHLRLELPEA